MSFLAFSDRHAVCYIGENLDDFAQQKAQSILCEQDGTSPCETCRSCIKVHNGTHPDLIWVREYKVKEVREVVATVAIRPNDGDFKVYIFTDADTMRVESQNALLKFTEEPPPYVRIIFTAKSPDLLLDTIKSRLFFVNTGGTHTEEPNELNNIAQGFVHALVEKDEYSAAAALAKIKTRDDLSKALDLISAEMNVGRDALGAPENYTEAQKFLLDCIDDLKYNPNIALFCTHITAGICKELKL